MKRVGIIFAMEEELVALKEYLKLEKEYNIFKDIDNIYVHDETTLDCSNFKDTNTLVEVSTMKQTLEKEKETQKSILNVGVSSLLLTPAN
jgi:hypothetical protein